MKAIPTLYNGIQFRSRLEATWAAFFDACGWKWEYEPAVFEGNGWTPDFWLPLFRYFVEIKPVVFPSDWPHHPAVKYAAQRVDGTGHDVLFLGLAPYEVLSELTTDDDRFIRRFTNLVLGPYYRGSQQAICGECTLHQCPEEAGEQSDSRYPDMMIANWPVGMNKFRLFDDGQCQEFGGMIGRQHWASAKNAVQWRPPGGP